MVNIAPGAFCAIGIHGQCIYVDEAAEILVARISSQPIALEFDKECLWLRRCGAIAVVLSRSA